jgi:hypothetical protein
MAVVVLIVGCGPRTDSAPVTSEANTTDAQASPEWLQLSLRYSARHSLGRRRLDVITVNNGSSDIVVTAIALRSEHFMELPAEAKTSRIMAGSRVAVKTDFGEVVDCGAPGSLSASVELTLVVGNAGEARQYLIPVDPKPLDDIRASDCNAQLITEAVAVAFGPDARVEGSSVVTELVVTRARSTEILTVAALRGMILFGMEPLAPTSGPVTVLGPEDEKATVPVRLTLARCDVHAVSQAPDGYSVRIWISVGGSEPILTTVFPHDRLQSQLESLVLECLNRS